MVGRGFGLATGSASRPLRGGGSARGRCRRRTLGRLRRRTGGVPVKGVRLSVGGGAGGLCGCATGRGGSASCEQRHDGQQGRDDSGATTRDTHCASSKCPRTSVGGVRGKGTAGRGRQAPWVRTRQDGEPSGVCGVRSLGIGAQNYTGWRWCQREEVGGARGACPAGTTTMESALCQGAATPAARPIPGPPHPPARCQPVDLRTGTCVFRRRGRGQRPGPLKTPLPLPHTPVSHQLAPTRRTPPGRTQCGRHRAAQARGRRRLSTSRQWRALVGGAHRRAACVGRRRPRQAGAGREGGWGI